jgi:hypothetical protein
MQHTLKSWFGAILIAVAPWSASTWAQAEARNVAVAPAPARAAIEVPFELWGNKIYLSVRVNGAEARDFALDTGSPTCVVDTDLAKELGLAVSKMGRAAGAGEGTIEAGMAGRLRFQAGELEYEADGVVVIPIKQTLAGAEGREMHGLLGGDLFQLYVVEIDYAGRRLFFHEPEGYRYSGPGALVPLKVGGHITARASFIVPGRGEDDAVKGDFMIDTGARVAATISTWLVDREKLLDGGLKTVRATAGYGVGGPVTHDIARLEELRLGSLRIKKPVVTLSQDTRGVFASRQYAGLIGGEVLRRYRVIFDYGRKHMILIPGPEAEAPYRSDACGVFLVAEGDDLKTYRVFNVAAGSAADEAGVKEGDVVERINGRSTRDMTLDEVRRVLRETEGKVELVLRREGEEVRVVVEGEEVV